MSHVEVCRERPELLAGRPVGQYHCPQCGCMVLAGMPHLPHDQGCAYGGAPDPVYDGPTAEESP